MSERPIRVLYLASTASKSGGSLHSLVDLAKQLKARNAVIPFIALPNHGSGEELLKEAGLEYVVYRSFGAEWPLGATKPLRQRISHFRQRFNNLIAVRGIANYAKKMGVEIIHVNTSIDEIGYYISKRARIPFVWHIREFIKESHGIEFYNERRQLRHMRSAHALITISNALCARYKTLLPKSNIVMIHNGIELTRFNKARPQSEDTIVRISSIGRVSKQKGHLDLIAAAKALIGRGITRFRMMFYGSFDESFVALVKQEHLSEYVYFCGFSDDVPSVLASSDIHVSASPWETFGRVTVEAMAAGCLVIGVNNAGTKDIIKDGETGFLYSPGDLSKLVYLLEQCISDPLLRAKIAKNGKDSSQAFSIQRCASKVLEVYQMIRS